MITRASLLLIGDTVERHLSKLQQFVAKAKTYNPNQLINPKRQQKKASMLMLGIKSGKTFNRLAKRARRLNNATN